MAVRVAHQQPLIPAGPVEVPCDESADVARRAGDADDHRGGGAEARSLSVSIQSVKSTQEAPAFS